LHTSSINTHAIWHWQAHRDVTVTRHGHWHDAIYDDTQIFSCVLLISFVFLQLTCACGE